MASSPSNLETRYDVVLASAGTEPRRVAPIIARYTVLRKREAWELLRRAPVPILQGVYYATAQGAKEALERRGATVELRAYDVEVPGPRAELVRTGRTLGGALLLAALLTIFFIIILIVASFSTCTIYDLP